MYYRVVTVDPQCVEANYYLEEKGNSNDNPIRHWVYCHHTLPFGCWIKGELVDSIGLFPLFIPDPNTHTI